MKNFFKRMLHIFPIIIATAILGGCEEDLNLVADDTTKSSLKAGTIIEQANYYVSPSGNDANPGTKDKPFKTWDKIIDVVKPGDLVYLRGGTYYKSKRVQFAACYLKGKSGAAGKYIRLWAYPGETPVLDCSTMSLVFGAGLYLSANYWHIKGIEIKNAPQGYNAATNTSTVMRGMKIENASYNIIENVKIHDNSGMGLAMNGSSTKNLIKNCDLYNNYDKLTRNSSGSLYPGGNADGAQLRANKGANNKILGCRFYNNSDDGLDLWENEGTVIIDSCWSFNNGRDKGDGNGYKLGKTLQAKESYPQRLIYHSIAAGNRSRGFDQNGANVTMTFYNNIAYSNKGSGYNVGNYNLKNSFANNVSLANGIKDIFTAESSMSKNSWNGIAVSASSFVSVNISELYNARQANGNLPVINFLKPVANSSVIDKGQILSFPYKGKGPDIGVFEL